MITPINAAKMETANEILMVVAEIFFWYFILVVYEVTKTLGVIMVWHSIILYL